MAKLKTGFKLVSIKHDGVEDLYIRTLDGSAEDVLAWQFVDGKFYIPGTSRADSDSDVNRGTSLAKLIYENHLVDPTTGIVVDSGIYASRTGIKDLDEDYDLIHEVGLDDYFDRGEAGDYSIEHTEEL